MPDLNKHIQIFWHELEVMYQRLIDGKDVAPAMHYRLEGKAQLFIDASVFTVTELEQKIETWLVKIDKQVPEAYWQLGKENGQVSLPVYMIDAPIYKS